MPQIDRFRDQVLAAASGQRWEDFVQTRVLDRVGMSETVPLMLLMLFVEPVSCVANVPALVTAPPPAPGGRRGRRRPR